MLQTFLPLFLMTFFICLFIVLMQFLWRYVGDLVGKGLSIDVLAQLFFYASLTFVPMALPLGIMLASLMTFGNMGESLELLAMKSSGISLIKIMRPLIVFMVMLSVATFFFQDRVLPYANTKMYSILLGIRRTKPALDIPEGIFYKQIAGYNIYVDHKDYEKGMLYGVTIYIFEGMNIEDATVTVADSAMISVAETGKHMKLSLWSGQQVGTFREGTGNNYQQNQNHPKYRREKFSEKVVYIPYENDFEADEEALSDRHVSKNLAQLTHSVDSLNQRIDSINLGYGKRLVNNVYFTQVSENVRHDTTYYDSITVMPREASMPIDLDSIYASLTAEQRKLVAQKARTLASNVVSTFVIQKEMQFMEQKNVNFHAIEIHRKFSLSVACLLFFFIGAPLGAIIRKGGLGIPIITGVLFFIFYYIIDNSGLKAAKDGYMEPWFGIWLSSMVLAPIGVWLTWRAINDSPLFDWDTYKIRFHHFMRWLMRHFKPAYQLIKAQAKDRIRHRQSRKKL